MDTKTKIFWWTMGILIVASFGATFYRYMIKKDYIVQAQVDCDPYTEVCFVWNCDPESSEEGEACVGNPEEDAWYFKVINKNASQISSCDAGDENCESLVCAQNELDCEFVFCNLENMEENYASSCIDPVQYTIENPIEEESECEEGDEECSDSEEESGAEVEEEGVESEEEIPTSDQETESMENVENIIEDDEGAKEADIDSETEKSVEDVSVNVEDDEGVPQDKIVQKNEGSESNSGMLPIVE